MIPQGAFEKQESSDWAPHESGEQEPRVVQPWQQVEQLEM
jgi:hypothetical protein